MMLALFDYMGDGQWIWLAVACLGVGWAIVRAVLAIAEEDDYGVAIGVIVGAIIITLLIWGVTIAMTTSKRRDAHAEDQLRASYGISIQAFDSKFETITYTNAQGQT